ncbi:hypothetical protein HXX76_009734 [Chlamydomonas incerta]|uniref:Uncharacterized protein n=1 Tax=Chlamydomonas incerta TaxID=51695 RepID=A0A835SST4_CHLIN|nr:hypothetical protein HXX76_009734 [Chlamydomonas incerta]|eukprot:KAG2431206.1 hypothetical protein HXX76_009734 [Chlamydomonas incerta]
MKWVAGKKHKQTWQYAEVMFLLGWLGALTPGDVGIGEVAEQRFYDTDWANWVAFQKELSKKKKKKKNM